MVTFRWHSSLCSAAMPVFLFFGQIFGQIQDPKVRNPKPNLEHEYVLSSHRNYFIVQDNTLGKYQDEQSSSASAVNKPQCLTTLVIPSLAKNEPRYSAVGSIVTAVVLGGAALYTYSSFMKYREVHWKWLEIGKWGTPSEQNNARRRELEDEMRNYRDKVNTGNIIMGISGAGLLVSFPFGAFINRR